MAPTHPKKHRIAMIGSGNWGSAVAKLVAENTAERTDLFERDVQMWVFEEKVTLDRKSKHYDSSNPLCTSPQPLTKLINTFHENVKYLPGAPLPQNLIANPSIQDAVKDATILVFNLPHQFINKTCADLKGHILPYARAISCVKGVDVTADEISLFSDVISEKLGIYCGALSGANIASEVAEGKFSETTVAYDPPAIDTRSVIKGITAPQTTLSQRNLHPVPSDFHTIDAELLTILFRRPYFHVRVTPDITAVSLAGALKNVVALAAGFVVGLGWGDNAKAAIMRVGLGEMVRFGHTFFPNSGIQTATFTEESAGVADLITSCSSGRNFRCARMSVEKDMTIHEVEKEMLNGQILQGVGTADEVMAFLKARGKEKEFPLFTAVYLILHGQAKAADLPQLLEPDSKELASPKL